MNSLPPMPIDRVTVDEMATCQPMTFTGDSDAISSIDIGNLVS